MKKNRIASFAAFVLAAAGTVSLGLADDTFKLDPVHSDVVFTIHHLVSNPSGTFHGPEGSVVVDGGVPKLDIKLPVEKLDMGNAKWEEGHQGRKLVRCEAVPRDHLQDHLGEKDWRKQGDQGI